MPNYTGRTGRLQVNGTDVGDVYNLSASGTKERIEVTAFGDTAKSYLGGLKDATVSFDCYLNDSDAGQALLVAGTTRSLLFTFENGVGGSPYIISASLYIDEVSYSSSVSDPVTVSVSATGTFSYYQ